MSMTARCASRGWRTSTPRTPACWASRRWPRSSPPCPMCRPSCAEPNRMPSEPRIVAVTGAAGVIGRNLVVRLEELGHDVRRITRASTRAETQAALAEAEVVFHLAGAIRPPDPMEFLHTVAFANDVAAAIARGGRAPLVIHSSSRKASADTGFGCSARACEEALLRLGERGEATVGVYRPPNVVG